MFLSSLSIHRKDFTIIHLNYAIVAVRLLFATNFNLFLTFSCNQVRFGRPACNKPDENKKLLFLYSQHVTNPCLSEMCGFVSATY